MEENNQNLNSEEREIDLIDLMGRFFNWFGRTFKTVFMCVLYFFIRNRYLYLVTITLIVVVSVSKSLLSEKYYDCEMTIQSKAVNASSVVNLINDWNYKRSLPEQLVNKIKSINATYLLDYNGDGIGDAVEKHTGKVVTDTAIIKRRMHGDFCVQIQIYNADNVDLLNTIRDSVISFISNDKWIRKQNEIRQNENHVIVDRIESEILTLDSLKYVEYFVSKDNYSLEKSGGLLMVSEKDKHLYYSDILSLLTKRLANERSFYFTEPFVVVRDFSTPMKAVNNPLYIFKSLAILILLLATVIIIIYDQRNNIKILIENSKQGN